MSVCPLAWPGVGKAPAATMAPISTCSSGLSEVEVQPDLDCSHVGSILDSSSDGSATEAQSGCQVCLLGTGMPGDTKAPAMTMGPFLTAVAAMRDLS